MATDVDSPLESLGRGIWWAVLLRGILAIIFGIIALIAPAAALTGIVLVFGAYAFVDGIFEIVQAVRTRSTDSHWGWLLFQGIVSVLAGLAALILPGVAAFAGGLFTLWLIVVYALVHGVLGIVSVAGLDRSSGKGWAILSAIISIVFAILLGVMVIVSPAASVLSLIWVVGIYAVALGIALIVAAFRVRRLVRSATDSR